MDGCDLRLPCTHAHNRSIVVHTWMKWKFIAADQDESSTAHRSRALTGARPGSFGKGACFGAARGSWSAAVPPTLRRLEAHCTSQPRAFVPCNSARTRFCCWKGKGRASDISQFNALPLLPSAVQDNFKGIIPPTHASSFELDHSTLPVLASSNSSQPHTTFSHLSIPSS